MIFALHGIYHGRAAGRGDGPNKDLPVAHAAVKAAGRGDLQTWMRTAKAKSTEPEQLDEPDESDLSFIDLGKFK